MNSEAPTTEDMAKILAECRELLRHATRANERNAK